MPHREVAIVFGAGLRKDGTPTSILRDRLDTAIELYFKGKVSKVLLSGGKGAGGYNEADSMALYTINHNVPISAITVDLDGSSTFETCWRSKYIYKITKAYLVTQRFHLPRTLYLSNKIGLNAAGVIADRRKYHFLSITYCQIREMIALSWLIISNLVIPLRRIRSD
ncbi:MAG TPA: YdcF family protein [Anaerolineae bacterium]|nr:YdcF family protein [Anaerolineae bacterium]